MIVMIPAMVSIHWGWSKLQNVEVFVRLGMIRIRDGKIIPFCSYPN